MAERWIALDGAVSAEPPALQRITYSHDYSETMSRADAMRQLIEYQEAYRAKLQSEVNSIIGEIAATRKELELDGFSE